MKILGEISRGGFGRVERVRVGKATYARKVLDPTPEILRLADASKLRKRFEREGRLQAQLSKNLFIPVHELHFDEDPPWILMALADEHLGDAINRARQAAEPMSTPLADILNALEELHGLDLVHRDLKPANVLLHEGIWKLSDLGLVLLPEELTTRITSTLSAWGTQTYCAPEQFQAFRNVTPAADIYSFGCILHDIWVDTPRVPYARQTGPGDIGIVIEKCTETDPGRRFKTVAALRGALLAILSNEHAVSADPTVEEWSVKLGDAPQWDGATLRRFAQLLPEITRTAVDQWVVYSRLDEDAIRSCFRLDALIANSIGLSYCEWASEGGHDFDYCDVIVKRLEAICESANIELKATAAIAAATMGRRHNRFFVMSRVLSLCGHHLDPLVARRLAIEIAVAEVQDDFRKCAEVIYHSIEEYHPIVSAVLGRPSRR